METSASYEARSAPSPYPTNQPRSGSTCVSPGAQEPVTKLQLQLLEWDKVRARQSNQPQSGGFVVSQARKPLVKWEIVRSRVAASLVS